MCASKVNATTVYSLYTDHENLTDHSCDFYVICFCLCSVFRLDCSAKEKSRTLLDNAVLGLKLSYTERVFCIN